jgi:hypothetical protein
MNKNKYLKYKNKYLSLKNHKGSSNNDIVPYIKDHKGGSNNDIVPYIEDYKTFISTILDTDLLNSILQDITTKYYELIEKKKIINDRIIELSKSVSKSSSSLSKPILEPLPPQYLTPSTFVGMSDCIIDDKPPLVWISDSDNDDD